MSKRQIDVLVVGAGIAGLLCAHRLQERGLRVVVLDKARGVGGRMSSRRIGGGRADHGAQFFTVQDDGFRPFVQSWLAAGLIREWFRHSEVDYDPEGFPRYVGTEGMSTVPKYLARSLEVRCGERVEALEHKDAGWTVTTGTGVQYAAAELVLTAPLPQAAELLAAAGVNWATGRYAQLAEVRYQRALAGIIVLDGESQVPAPGFVRFRDGRLTWIADNRQKGISPNVTTLTLHTSNDFANAYWEASDSLRSALMVEAAQPFLGARVREVTVHRWGYTLPKNPWPEGSARMPELRLTLAGDAFGGPRVEGAALSGLDAAGRLLETRG